MRNNSKKELTKQEEFMRRHRRHHHEIALWRALVFVLFLALWELSADLCWIDSFFFSSPSRVVLCLVKQIRTNSMLFHIGVTLFETIASFLLVLFFSLVMSTLLWCSTKLSEVLEPYLVVLNSLPTFMCDKIDEVKKSGAALLNLSFTTESAADVKRALGACFGSGFKPSEFTRLHFNKGAITNKIDN